MKYPPFKIYIFIIDQRQTPSNQKFFFQSRHPDFEEADIVFVSGEVGEGGDHVNINLKNIGDKEVSQDDFYTKLF